MIAQKSAQLKEFAAFEAVINVRIPTAIVASPDVKAILKRAKKPSGNAKAVAQVVLDVSCLPITQPRPHQVRTDKMWVAHQVLVQLVEKAQEKVRAPLRPPPPPPVIRTLALCHTDSPHPPTYPPPIARARGPSLAGQNGQGQEGEGPRQAAQTGEFERRPPVRRANEGMCGGMGVSVCVCLSQCT